MTAKRNPKCAKCGAFLGVCNYCGMREGKKKMLLKDSREKVDSFYSFEPVMGIHRKNN